MIVFTLEAKKKKNPKTTTTKKPKLGHGLSKYDVALPVLTGKDTYEKY
jgi:hypothetical protein